MGNLAADGLICRLYSIPRRQRSQKVQALRGNQHFDGDNMPHIFQNFTGLASGDRPHADMIFLVGGSRDGIDAGRMGQHFVFGDKRRGRVLRNHQTGIHTRISRQKWRQIAQMRIQHAIDPTFGNTADFRQGCFQIVHGQRHRLAMKIAAGNHFAGIGKD